MSESLDALRTWFHANKGTPEFLLAQKHRHAMAAGVADELKSRARGDTDEERELSLMFTLTQVAEKLDLHAVLLAGIQVEHLPPVAHVPTSHVDVTPLEPDHDELAKD